MSVLMESLPQVLHPYKEKILATEKPSIEIGLTPNEQVSIWQSKVGGHPYLPLDMQYPLDDEQRPLLLLAQVNFAELPANEIYPSEGILQFFIGTDDLYGLNFDDQQQQNGFRIIYHEKIITELSQLHQTFPDIDQEYSPISGQYAVQYSLSTKVISTNDFAFGQKILDVEQLYDFEEQYQGEDFYDEFVEPYDETFSSSGHRLGGYPYFTQNDPREYTEQIQDYVLLLQIDTDDGNGHDIMWGDSGVGNFFIHPDDLKKRDFSKVIYNWDCC